MSTDDTPQAAQSAADFKALRKAWNDAEDAVVAAENIADAAYEAYNMARRYSEGGIK